MAIQMTRKEYEMKYGSVPFIPSESQMDITVAPRIMTQAEYDEEFGVKEKKVTQGDLKAFQDLDKYKQKVSEASDDADAQIFKGFEQSKGTRNPLKMIEGGITGATGLANKLFSPVAPLFEPLGKAIDFVGDKVSNIPAVQKVAKSKAGGVLSRLFENVTNVSNIAGAALGVKNPLRSKTYVGKTSFPEPLTPKPVSKSVIRLADEINEIENNYSKLRKANDFEKDMGAQSRQRIAQTDVLANSVDESGTIRTNQKGGAVEKYRKQTIDGSEGIVRENLVIEKASVNVAEVQRYLVENIDKSFEGSDLTRALNGIKGEIEGLSKRADSSGNILLEKIHDAKIGTTQNINYRVDSTPTIKYRKIKASTYRQIIEDKSKFEVDVNGKKYKVGDINKELGKYYGDIERLQNLDGRKVKGGKLGKYTAQLSGNLIGGAAGAIFGAPGAAIGGLIGGEAAGFIKGKAFANTFGKERGVSAPKNDILGAAKKAGQLAPKVDLTVASPKVGAKKSVIKTKEITAIESQISNNVKKQKAAIKAGDFSLVATLKEVYDVLVFKLKELVQAIKNTPNQQGGFVGLGKKVSKDTPKGVTPESVGKKMTFEDREIAHRIIEIQTLGTDLATYQFLEDLKIDKLDHKEQIRFLKEAVDYSNSLGRRNTI